MSERANNERGETLVEILMAVVLIGFVFSAFFATYSTAAKASATQRNAAQVDAILRNAAEATKNAVRVGCASATASTPGATYATPPPPPPPFSLSVTSSPPGQTCPAVGSLQHVTFSVSAPGAVPSKLTIELRTP